MSMSLPLEPMPPDFRCSSSSASLRKKLGVLSCGDVSELMAKKTTPAALSSKGNAHDGTVSASGPVRDPASSLAAISIQVVDSPQNGKTFAQESKGISTSQEFSSLSASGKPAANVLEAAVAAAAKDGSDSESEQSDDSGGKSPESVASESSTDSEEDDNFSVAESEKEDPDEFLSKIELHPFHTKPGAMTENDLALPSEKRFAPKMPVRLAGCQTVKQFHSGSEPDAAEVDFVPVGLPGIKGMSAIAIVPEETSKSGSSEKSSRTISRGLANLFHRVSGGVTKSSESMGRIGEGDVGNVEGATSESSSNAAMIRRRDFDQLPDFARRSGGDSDGIEGWVFLCSTAHVQGLLELLRPRGCICYGLRETYLLCIGGKTGAGSFGSVVCAYPKGWGTHPVAVKLLKVNTKESAIQKEINMLVAAQGHPFIVKFRGVFVDFTGSLPNTAKQWSLVFDYFGNGDLYDRVVEGRRMTEPDAMPILQNILGALLFLQGREIFHRDVKPENLLVAALGNVVLTDFGISCSIHSSVEMASSTGTVGYASPEMLEGTSTSFDGDAFGAGVVLDHISKDCTRLILGLIQKDVKERLKVKDAISIRCVDAFMVPRTEAVLPSMDRVRKERTSGCPVSASAGHGGAVASVGALPPLRRAQQNPKDIVR
eukprot:CAMPEP_0115143840 /NCGR_PEP_ID=MMETSP0227-20121206/61023_1 /TAXON_ID=89957 /ORGANISM="Polarella glacialis, Strain CCMP 1383" /LENGTH=655 /DNA_ID=CAMNT_0002552771 /DNA_START=97 /DNA_END=2065 /DNA_ORIENTATION=+